MLLSGCSEDRADWYGDERFTPAERVAIQQGFDWLNQQAGLPSLTIDWSYKTTDGETLPNTIRRERGPDLASGECYKGAIYLALGGVPEINSPPVSMEQMPGLAAHELAHCELGFVDGYHPQDPPTDGIMRVLVPMRWTDSEQAQCREHADKCPAGR